MRGRGGGEIWASAFVLLLPRPRLPAPRPAWAQSPDRYGVPQMVPALAQSPGLRYVKLRGGGGACPAVSKTVSTGLPGVHLLRASV